MPAQLSPVRTGRHRSPLTTDHDHCSFNYLPASSPAAPATPTLSVPRLDADDEHISVHDLLDLTWHYQCVVSPSFSAAALAGALSGQLTSKIRSPSSSSAGAGATYTDQNLLKELKLKIKDNCRGRAQFDLLRVRHKSVQAGGPPSLQSAEAVLCRLQPEAMGENYGHLTSHSHGKSTEGDGYVSLASLLMGSPEASMDITSPTSESPHHNYIELALDLFNFKKQNIKTRSRTSSFASRTCRDNERMSARHHSGADPSRIASYARCLAVD